MKSPRQSKIRLPSDVPADGLAGAGDLSLGCLDGGSVPHEDASLIFKSFTLPWFAILGAHKALEHNLGIWSAIIVGLIATTAGGVFIDLFSGVTPEIVRPSQQLVTTAVLASSTYILLALATEVRTPTSFPSR